MGFYNTITWITMNKKEYISPALFFIESEERCCLNTASVLQGDDNEVIDTFPVEDNPKDFDFSLPDNWGGD